MADGNHRRTIYRLGYWSSIACVALAVAYIVPQVADFAELLGPHDNPVTLIVLMAPSALLATAFVVLTVSIHAYVPAEKKIWSHLGVAFAIMYAVLVSIVYFVQLTFVIPHQLRGTEEAVGAFLFTAFDSFMFVLDVLGYSFMNLSTLFLAFAFGSRGEEKWIRGFLVANGILFPTNILSMYYHPMLWMDGPWAITFPAAMILLARMFRNALRERSRAAGTALAV